MRTILRLLALLVLLAAVAQQEVAYEHETTRVPVSHVWQPVCRYDGGISYVVGHPALPGVYRAHCRDGVVLVTGNR